MIDELVQLEYSERQQKGYEHLQTLYVVNDMLKQAEADGLDIDIILPRILQVAAVELNASTGSIIILDHDKHVEHGWVVEGTTSYEPHYVPFLQRVISEGIAGIATRTHQTICITNTLSDPRWLPRPNHITARDPWSAICTPLIAQQRAIGALTVTRPGISQFDKEDADLLIAIGGQAAITIENARLYAASQRQLREAELFAEASQAINASLDTQEVMQSMLSQMNDLLNAEAISVALVDGSELVYTVADGAGSSEIIGLRLPSNQGISGWVMEHAATALVNDPHDDPRFHFEGDRRTGLLTHAMICAPLQAHGRVLGTIQAINPESGYFSYDDLRILERLANLASSAIANAEQFMKTQEAESRYSNLFEDSIDPILITSREGIIREVNRHACTILEYSRHQLVGESIDILHHTGISNSAEELLQDTTGRVKIFKSQALSRSGKEIPVEVHIKRIVSRATDELQWIYHDISKQVELEQMRNDLTAMLFHDLQNPLSNVISSLELVEMELPEESDPILSMMVKVASRSSQRLRHLIRSLLDINQLEAGAPVHERMYVQISDIFGYVAEMMEASVERKHIRFVSEVCPEVPEVFANQDMVERVIINLLDNALKFSRRDDTITLHAQLSEYPHCVQFSVSDEGPGIPAKFRRSIFDKFYRAPNNTSKGIGLGLAFCRLAVEAHGGMIWVTEAKGGGACFNFTIPTRKLN